MNNKIINNGYDTLRKAVEEDVKKDGIRDSQEYWDKFNWVLKRAEHYAKKTGLTREEILNAWESNRNFWYMNYYQDAFQPKIEGDHVRVFDTLADLMKSIGDFKFRCPYCEQISTNPYQCNSGYVENEKVCDWTVHGLFGDLGKGVYVFVKEKGKVENIFMPIRWE